MSNYKCSYGKNCECKTDEEKSTCDLAFETKTNKMKDDKAKQKEALIELTEMGEYGNDKMSKEKECPHCHQVGFHKLSCPTQKVTVFIPTLEGDEAEEFIRKADENVKAMQKRLRKKTNKDE